MVYIYIFIVGAVETFRDVPISIQVYATKKFFINCISHTMNNNNVSLQKYPYTKATPNAGIGLAHHEAVNKLLVWLVDVSKSYYMYNNKDNYHI